MCYMGCFKEEKISNFFVYILLNFFFFVIHIIFWDWICNDVLWIGNGKVIVTNETYLRETFTYIWKNYNKKITLQCREYLSNVTLWLNEGVIVMSQLPRIHFTVRIVIYTANFFYCLRFYSLFIFWFEIFCVYVTICWLKLIGWFIFNVKKN